MRRFKKILKWTAFILLFLVTGLTATILGRQNVKYDRPYPAIMASADSNVILRGKQLVFGAGHCADCHFKGNADSLLALGQEPGLSGGYVFDLPVGKIYVKNITPDKETGIGNYTDSEIARALRYGVHPDGTAIFNFMSFQNMSDEDITAIISYLRSCKPVKNEIPKNSLNFLGKAVNAFMVKPVGPSGEVPQQVKQEVSVAYGSYLANSVANCGGCHTQRTLSGEFTGAPYAGGNDIDGFITPNITPDSSSRIFGWTEEHFVNRFRMGRLKKGSPMPWPSFGRMTDDELKAIYAYLKTLDPVKTTPEKK